MRSIYKGIAYKNIKYRSTSNKRSASKKVIIKGISKKIVSVILAFTIMLLYCNAEVFAKYSDVPGNAQYSDAVERITALGIMSASQDNKFFPDNMVTREQLAKIIILAANLGSMADMMKGSTVFADVPVDSWSSGYINYAVNKGYMAGMPDGKFHPADNVTFAQVCTALIKMLGYTDSDLMGNWPYNYIEKAKTLGITDGINLKDGDFVPRWAMAVMADRLLNTSVKSGSQSGSTSSGTGSDSGKKYAESTGLFYECIILADSSTTVKLTEYEVQTDRGILINQSGTQLEVGKKYMVKLKQDIIEKVYGEASVAQVIKVSSFTGMTVYYKVADITSYINLPVNTVYYYNGNKQDYNGIKNILKRDQTIYLGFNRERTAYEYILIKDMYDDSYGQYTECIILDNGKTSPKIAEGQVLTDLGIYKVSDSVVEPVVGEKYALYIKDDTITAIHNNLSTVKKAKVKNSSDGIVEVMGENGYEELVLRQNAIYYYNGVKQNYESLKNILKSTQEIYIGYVEDNIYEYVIIRDVYDNSYGTYTECIIMDDSTTSLKIGANQILTDKGIFILPKNGEKLEIGAKYGLYVKDNAITAVYKKLNTIITGWVHSAEDVQVIINDNGNLEIIKLPQNTDYYYNGVKQNYDSLKNVLKPDQTIYLSYDSEREYYDYVLIKNKYDESFGTYTECIIMGNSITTEGLESNQVLTDKGIYTISSSVPELELGVKYGLYVKNDVITGIYGALNTVTKTTVMAAIENKVTLIKDGQLDTITLPQKTQYYKNGNKVDYNSLKGTLQRNTSIVFAWNKDKTNYEYAIVFDPVYSKPQLATIATIAEYSAGNINYSGADIIKDGDIIKISAVSNLDVLYEVTDVWEGNRYINLVSNLAYGTIKGFSPSILSPQKIQVEVYDPVTDRLTTNTYDISKEFDMIKFLTGGYKTGDIVYVILGRDGKVVFLLKPEEAFSF